MRALPQTVLRKLREVSKKTGIAARELWSRQSKATKLLVFRDAWEAFWDRLSGRKRAALKNNWKFWGRPAQQIPLIFFIWLILAGRGWGKTRTGAQFSIQQARSRPGSRGMLVGPTAADIRDTMVGGDSGILACSPPDFIPIWEPSKLRLTWPNGSWAICRTADSPDRMRGPNLDWAWADEMACWRFLKSAWDMMMMCLRKKSRGIRGPRRRRAGAVGERVKGLEPQLCISTTPRPLEEIKQLVKDSKKPKNQIVVTRGSSWDNYWVLSKRWFKQVIERATGALARQEIWAEILDKVEGALWSFEQIWALEVKRAPKLECIAVGVDPAEEDGPDNDEVGIVAVGRGENQHGYTLEDRSCKGKPGHWARVAYELYLQLEANVIVVETNRGGQMCAHTIRSVVKPGEPLPKIVEVKATKGKRTRGEPISALWDVKRFHSVGKHAKLENEMCTYVPGVSPRSPNRFDAMIWASTYLFPSKPLPPTNSSGQVPAGW